MSRPVFFALFTLTTAGAMLTTRTGWFIAFFILSFAEMYIVTVLDRGAFLGGSGSAGGAIYRREKMQSWLEEEKFVGGIPQWFIRWMTVQNVWYIVLLLALEVFIYFRGSFPSSTHLRRQMFLVYYLINVCIICISPRILFLVFRWKLWKGLKNACRKYGFSIHGTLKGLARTGKAKGALPPVLELNTPAERFRICVLGRPGTPRLYVFHTEGDKILGYTMVFSALKGDRPDPHPETSPEVGTASRRTKKKRRFPFRLPNFNAEMRTLYAFPPAEKGVTNILLFCPDGVICREFSTGEKLECGNELCGYTVYNTERFLKGRLGEYLKHPGEVRHAGGETPPEGAA